MDDPGPDYLKSNLIFGRLGSGVSRLPKKLVCARMTLPCFAGFVGEDGRRVCAAFV